MLMHQCRLWKLKCSVAIFICFQILINIIVNVLNIVILIGTQSDLVNYNLLFHFFLPFGQKLNVKVLFIEVENAQKARH